MSDPFYDQFSRDLVAGGVDSALAALAVGLAEAGRGPELFEVRLMQARAALGLPLASGTTLDELPDVPRAQLEERYLAACREVGHLLLARGEIPMAWRYLRVVGDREATAQAMRTATPADDQIAAWIEIGLVEGVAPELGFELLLAHYGTCQAITTYDAQVHGRPRAQQQAIAGVLVRRLHGDLVDNVRSDLERRGVAWSGTSLTEALALDPELLADNNYHIDTSHLAAVVRFARVLDDPATLRLALDLAEYGRALAPAYHYRGEVPFEDVYTASRLYFAASLGQDVDEALSYFRAQVEAAASDHARAVAAEVYVALLARTGRAREAFDVAIERLPSPWHGSALVDSLAELAQQAGRVDDWAAICRERGDLLGYAAAQAASRAAR
ncbi:MAG: hypothetical protein K1X74_01630 [Pirellulales bacterium]|nr:hypothetical protein [Pirellulales bacterium]